jgi:F-type H+-transporting ATPase subunit delta
MLRGASAEARKDLVVRAGGSDTLDENAVLGEQLFAVARMLRAEPALRRICTDASVDAEAKAGLASSVFSGKLDQPALDLTSAAVRQRWTSSGDLAEVLEELGVQALVRSAGPQASQVEDELFAVAQLIDGNHDLRAALSDPARTDDEKCGLIASLLEDDVLPATLQLVRQAERSELPIVRALAEFEAIAAGVQQELLAVVHTARPLGATETDRLARALGKAYNATVHLHVVEDPSLIGGLRVKIGDDVIDGTVASRLDEASRRLAG